MTDHDNKTLEELILLRETLDCVIEGRRKKPLPEHLQDFVERTARATERLQYDHEGWMLCDKCGGPAHPNIPCSEA